MPLDFNTAYSTRLPVVVGNDNQRYIGPATEFVTGTIPVFNDFTVPYPPGTVLITGVNSPTWRAGRIAAGAEPPPVYVPADACVDSANYTGPYAFLGVSLGFIAPAAWGRAATAGSIVPVRCNDATVDTQLQTRGIWVRWSANTDDDPSGLAGCVESLSVVSLVSATASISRPGTVVGQIIVPAGIGPDRTGSNFIVIVRINPR